MPQIKFLKKTIPDIIAGNKTMEVRPRSPRWIAGFKVGQTVDFTWGSRYTPPTVFATGRIERIEIKPFAAANQEDVIRFGGRWVDLSVNEFIIEHERWYAEELAKGKIVVWIYFNLV